MEGSKVQIVGSSSSDGSKSAINIEASLNEEAEAAGRISPSRLYGDKNEGAELAADRISPSRYGDKIGGGNIIRSIPDLEGGKKKKKSLKNRMLWFGKPVLWYWVLMTISATGSLVGGSAGSLLGRFYFVQGGNDRWIYAWLQTAGCPVLVIPAAILAGRCNRGDHTSWSAGAVGGATLSSMYRRRLLLWSLVIGLLLGVDNLLFSWGLSYLPASTNSLLNATLLAFNIASSAALLRRRLTGWAVNAAVIVTTSAVILGLQSRADRPPHITGRQYVIGFVAALLGAALYGLVLSVTELAYAHIGSPGKAGSSFPLVIYLQLGSSVVSTLFAMVGMAAAGSFSIMQAEYRTFHAGRGAYVATLLLSALSWQAFFLGVFGVTSLSSSLLSCLFTTATLPIVPILAVFIFHDSFNVVKGVSTFLAVWGFMSYIYGGLLDSQTSTQHKLETEGPVELISASPPQPG